MSDAATKVFRGKQFTLCGPPLPAARVNKLLTEARIWVPEDYRQFLIEINGGAPDEDVFEIPAGPDWRANTSMFQYFLGLDGARDDLIEFNASWWFRDRGYVNIGYDAGGNDIAIDTRTGASHGQIVFVDHERLETESNAYPLARSFTEFVDRLWSDEAPRL